MAEACRRKSETAAAAAAGNGLDVVNLRNLGYMRSLVLLDGQRVVGANPVGVVDISQFPQGLISRVDVVTGGASASWGSDAVAGVVNFVLDHDFNGLKGNFAAGETTYGDDRSLLGQLTGGMPFADDRGHVEAGIEYYTNNGVPNGTGSRTWYQGSKILQRTITGTPAGAPQLISAVHVAPIVLAPGGIALSGPLTGTIFGPGGQPSQFQFGSPVISPYMVGVQPKSGYRQWRRPGRHQFARHILRPGLL